MSKPTTFMITSAHLAKRNHPPTGIINYFGLNYIYLFTYYCKWQIPPLIAGLIRLYFRIPKHLLSCLHFVSSFRSLNPLSLPLSSYFTPESSRWTMWFSHSFGRPLKASTSARLPVAVQPSPSSDTRAQKAVRAKSRFCSGNYHS